MKRFVHELRYSRKITHHNVIRIYDFLYIQGNYAISMEYFPSHTLGAEIVNEKPVELKRALQFGIDIATGMTVAHQVGIVHRDLKPANVLINDEGLLKIVDFGVAAAQREGDTQLTKTGYVIGSPKYMAPEQILGRKVDERADVYAVGRDAVRDADRRAALLARRSHGGHVPARAGQGARAAGDQSWAVGQSSPKSSSRPWRSTRPSASRPWKSCAARWRGSCKLPTGVRRSPPPRGPVMQPQIRPKSVRWIKVQAASR